MGRTARQLIAPVGLSVIFSATLAGCAATLRNGQGAIARESSVESTRPEALRTSAAAALLEQSRASRRDRNYAAAATTLDRALRIEPDAAVLWLEYAELRYAEGDFEQALTLARKAATLTSDDATRQAASKLIADANRERARASYAAERELEQR